MVRRSFLQTLGALPLASGAAKETSQRTRFYTIETFFLANGDQPGRLRDFMSRAFVPSARKFHRGPEIFLEALVASHLPQYVAVMGFGSSEEALSLYSKLHKQEGYTAAVERWESGPNPPYQRTSMALLEAADFSPELGEPAMTPRIFELRVYHSPTWRQLGALLERFAGPEIAIFRRSGIHPVLYATTVVGNNLPNLTYLIPFQDLGAREKAWAAFAADPEWTKVRGESVARHGEVVSSLEVSLYRAAPYSPFR